MSVGIFTLGTQHRGLRISHQSRLQLKAILAASATEEKVFISNVHCCAKATSRIPANRYELHCIRHLHHDK